MTSSSKIWNATLDVAEQTIASVPRGYVSLIVFSDEKRPLKIISGAEDSVKELERIRHSDKKFARGRTALWDAVVFAVNSLNLANGDSVVAVSDDGEN